MKLKIRKQIVDVNSSKCKKYKCLRIGYYTHHNAAGNSGISARTDDELSCITRDNFGCPDIEDRRRCDNGKSDIKR